MHRGRFYGMMPAGSLHRGSTSKVWTPISSPPILQRLKMNPDQYLTFVRKPKSGFANSLGALDKLKEFARHFDKRFLRGQTAAAALFSPGR